jgi:argininosuccinate lyase
MNLLLLKRGLEEGLILIALVTLCKDLPVSDNRDIQYSCEGYMALALVVQETFSSLLVVTLNDVRMA